MSITAIVLAAGQGSRMNSDRPKVLHEIGGVPMLGHALSAVEVAGAERVVVVAGVGAEQVERALTGLSPDASVVRQTEQLGTAHAVLAAREALADATGQALVIYGDTPFIRPETFEAMLEARATHDVVVLGFEAADPGRYGRLVTEGDTLLRIVEFKDATDEERAITLCNSGVVCADVEKLMALAGAVGNANASGEYYLTDIVGLAREQGLSATVVRCDEAETLGVNTRAELAAAEAAFQSRKRAQALEDGVSLAAPETVYFAPDTVIGRDALVEPNVVFGPGVTVESGARIRAFSHLEGCHVSRGATVGPFARLRPGAELSEDVHVGNFVEIKNATVGEGAKVNHLTYIGDADIGARTNIGAGTITCNYDGYGKAKTVIGEGAFVGSNSSLVAPVEIADGAYVGSGSVITKDVPKDALSVARGRQVTKDGWAAAFRAKHQKD